MPVVLIKVGLKELEITNSKLGKIKIKEAFADVLKVLILECITPVKMAVCTVMQISTVKWHEKTITNITHYLH